MSATVGALRVLVVEGTNDQFVAIETVKKLRPTWDREARRWGGGFKVDDAKGDANAIIQFRLALTLGPNARAGLILDADDQPGKHLADRIALLQNEFPALSIPTAFPTSGWVNHAHSPRCGVWLMPDNQHDGALEAFVAPFHLPADSTIAFAGQCADDARSSHGAPWKTKDAAKARLHTWLAWRQEPGRRTDGLSLRATSRPLETRSRKRSRTGSSHCSSPRPGRHHFLLPTTLSASTTRPRPHYAATIKVPSR